MLDFIQNIFKPAAELVDNLHTSDEEKLKLRNEFAKIQAGLSKEAVSLMKAEASSESSRMVKVLRDCCFLGLIFAAGRFLAPGQRRDTGTGKALTRKETRFGRDVWVWTGKIRVCVKMQHGP